MRKALMFNNNAFLPGCWSTICLSKRGSSQVWILDHEQVSTVIPGAKTVEQAFQNAGVSKFASLSKEAHLKLNSLYVDKIDSNVRGRY